MFAGEQATTYGNFVYMLVHVGFFVCLLFFFSILVEVHVVAVFLFRFGNHSQTRMHKWNALMNPKTHKIKSKLWNFIDAYRKIRSCFIFNFHCTQRASSASLLQWMRPYKISTFCSHNAISVVMIIIIWMFRPTFTFSATHISQTNISFICVYNFWVRNNRKITRFHILSVIYLSVLWNIRFGIIEPNALELFHVSTRRKKERKPEKKKIWILPNLLSYHLT